LKISESALELGVEDIFVTTVTQFSSTVSEEAVVYVRRRCQRQQLNWVSWMIFGKGGTQFSSTVSQSAVVYVRKSVTSAVELGFLDDFWVPGS